MRRLALVLATVALAAMVLAAPAGASFGFSSFDVVFSDSEGAGSAQAGSHPFAMTTSFEVNTKEAGTLPDGAVKDLLIFQVPGFLGDQTAVPRCANLNFLEVAQPHLPNCPNSTAIGLATVTVGNEGGKGTFTSPFFNLEPSPGQAAKLGFFVRSIPITVDIGLSPAPPHNLLATSRNISQVLEFFGGEFEIWGVPADPDHDTMRGSCIDALGESAGSCPAGVSPRPFLTLPRACEGPLATVYEMDSWQSPGAWVTGSALTHDDAVPPNPQGMIGCGKVGFGPRTDAQPSTASAESSAGIEITIDVTDEGLKNPAGIAQADIASILTRFPAGVTANPSAAEGLGTCSLARYEEEQLGTPAGFGCPDASKLGTIEAVTPLLEDHPLRGSLYLAAQGEGNPFGSLLALYLVIRDPELGIFVKLAGRVDTDPKSGRLVSLFEDLPPFPLSHVEVSLRSGPRAPLITPPTCGIYETEMELTPSSGAAPLISTSNFEITSGPGGGPCPQGLPFDPGFQAGSESNAAGRYSPFSMQITRKDGEQDITRFSATLPPGVVGKIAGLSQCPDGAIASAKAKSGRSEQASPSCPESSKLGSVIGGAGVGSALTYVPGSLYLAGPYNGAPLSVAAIVPAVAGPFDVGTVVTRVALDLNSVTGEVEVDGSRSDPIPHILEGIPLKVRDLRVYADRPEFTINPTSCEESSTRAQIFGGGADFLSAADDSPFAASSRYQAASCASLAFKPKLAIELKGGNRRGDFPALRATVTPRPADANFADAVVTLPKSAFLEQGHIGTICTRVQFAAGAGNGAGCPAASIYGKAKAWSPLLAEPAQGPVFLRSSNNNLPDLVVALQGPPSAPFQVELASRIDSVKGGIRSSFESIPDVPVSRFVLEMRGGRKGLIVNSRNLCAKPAKSKAKASLEGQNGRRSETKPVVRAAGCGGKGHGGKRARRSRHGRAR